MYISLGNIVTINILCLKNRVHGQTIITIKSEALKVILMMEKMQKKDAKKTGNHLSEMLFFLPHHTIKYIGVLFWHTT